MRAITKLTASLILFLYIANPCFSQKHFYKAQKQFELKAFDQSIESAKKAIQEDQSCIDCHLLIAEAFRMMNHNVDAAIWYRKMERFNNLPSDYAFNYALLLKRMGQYDKAKRYFEEYKIIDAAKGTYFAESCDFAKAELSKEKNFELNLFGVSSRNTDFGPTVYKNQIVFSSFRPDFKRDISSNNKSSIQKEVCQFFIADNAFDSDVNSIDFLLKDGTETFDMGPIHYAAKAPVCAVTKQNFKDGEKQVFANDLELTLYIGQVENDGSFNSLKPFPHNEVGYATGFGTLNPSGDILYFSSNRPGGHGGFDIYVSYFKSGKWSYPANLGKNINTEGNEITPFFDGEDLYFSSDYITGIGGFDVFNSYVDNGEWTLPSNMGNGVNSPEDDYYFTKHPHVESYYLTSNRLGGRGNHDIYLVHNLGMTQSQAELAANEVSVPRAINLETDLIDDNIKPQVVTVNNPTTISSKPAGIIENKPAPIVEENEPIDFNKLLPPKAVDLNSNNSRSISLAGAKRVSYGEVIRSSSNVYFIQLAALFKSKANLNSFAPLSNLGSIYRVNQATATKIKLGYFIDEYAAKEALRQVKAMGHNDAFITFEALNTSRMELVTISDDVIASHGDHDTSTTGTNYKVRLASYEDPIWFDVTKVNGLGVIEQWSKGTWTIFVLSGYNSMDEAEVAKINAIIQGFRDAEVVLDRNGILENLD